MLTMACPEVGENAEKYVRECLQQGRLAEGRFIGAFEAMLAEFCGAKYAVATCNGTMADAVMLRALADRFPGRKLVMLPALTFAAQANAVLIAQLKPVFTEVDNSMTMKFVKTSSPPPLYWGEVLCTFPAHLLGRKSQLPATLVPAVEDACQATGVFEFGYAAAYSFFASHSITTGEGGAIVMNDPGFADECRRIRNHGRRSNSPLDAYRFDVFGFDAKMSNLTAAVGLAALEIADETLALRREIVAIYNDVFQRNWSAESPHAYPLELKSKVSRDSAVLALHECGIETRTMFGCLPTHDKAFEKFRFRNFPVAEKIADVTILLPIHSEVTKSHIEKMREVIGCV